MCSIVPPLYQSFARILNVYMEKKENAVADIEKKAQQQQQQHRWRQQQHKLKCVLQHTFRINVLSNEEREIYCCIWGSTATFLFLHLESTANRCDSACTQLDGCECVCLCLSVAGCVRVRVCDLVFWHCGRLHFSAICVNAKPFQHESEMRVFRALFFFAAAAAYVLCQYHFAKRCLCVYVCACLLYVSLFHSQSIVQLLVSLVGPSFFKKKDLLLFSVILKMCDNRNRFASPFSLSVQTFHFNIKRFLRLQRNVQWLFSLGLDGHHTFRHIYKCIWIYKMGLSINLLAWCWQTVETVCNRMGNFFFGWRNKRKPTKIHIWKWTENGNGVSQRELLSSWSMNRWFRC